MTAGYEQRLCFCSDATKTFQVNMTTNQMGLQGFCLLLFDFNLLFSILISSVVCSTLCQLPPHTLMCVGLLLCVLVH